MNVFKYTFMYQDQRVCTLQGGVDWYMEMGLKPTRSYHYHQICTVGMYRKNRNSVRIRFLKTELSKNLTSIQTVFRQKLHAIRHLNKK